LAGGDGTVPHSIIAMRRFFRALHPFYLHEHSRRTSQRLPFLGGCGVLCPRASAL
jgi:hypothetical protein